MSPQPAAAPTQHAKGSPHWLVQQARDLEHEMDQLRQKIGANRASLRSLLKADALEDDLAKFVREFYPEKAKGVTRSKEEIETSRKAREAARKGLAA